MFFKIVPVAPGDQLNFCYWRAFGPMHIAACTVRRKAVGLCMEITVTSRAHHVIVPKIRWEPFWLASQLYPPNDWDGRQFHVNSGVCTQTLSIPALYARALEFVAIPSLSLRISTEVQQAWHSRLHVALMISNVWPYKNNKHINRKLLSLRVWSCRKQRKSSWNGAKTVPLAARRGHIRSSFGKVFTPRTCIFLMNSITRANKLSKQSPNQHLPWTNEAMSCRFFPSVFHNFWRLAKMENTKTLMRFVTTGILTEYGLALQEWIWLHFIAWIAAVYV